MLILDRSLKWLRSLLLIYPPERGMIFIRGCTGFDGNFEVGEASRRNALNPKLNTNAEDNLAYAA